MKKKQNNNWSIQIPSSTAEMVKDYCHTRGMKMNWYTDKALHLCVSGSLITTHISGSII